MLWPSTSPMPLPTWRATISVMPPAPTGPTSRTGRSGNPACAPAPIPAASASAATLLRTFMPFPLTGPCQP
ncbi:hypothetical protein G6F46_015735 [Rhizopus delemar]|nr:hypothetical protein G6F46_015735 [Rhizopus delemar]